MTVLFKNPERVEAVTRLVEKLFTTVTQQARLDLILVWYQAELRFIATLWSEGVGSDSEDISFREELVVGVALIRRAFASRINLASGAVHPAPEDSQQVEMSWFEELLTTPSASLSAEVMASLALAMSQHRRNLKRILECYKQGQEDLAY